MGNTKQNELNFEFHQTHMNKVSLLHSCPPSDCFNATVSPDLNLKIQRKTQKPNQNQMYNAFPIAYNEVNII